MNNVRTKPSSKAREQSYRRITSLMWMLEVLNVVTSFDDYFINTNKVLKDYVIKHTPPDKRGGPSNH